MEISKTSHLPTSHLNPPPPLGELQIPVIIILNISHWNPSLTCKYLYFD